MSAISYQLDLAKGAAVIPFLPLSLLAVGLPFIGGSASAKAGIKKTLANVNGAVWYTKAFLLGLTTVFVAVLVVWTVVLLSKRRRQRKISRIATLLQRIESDTALIREKDKLESELLGHAIASKQKALIVLETEISKPFFKKHFGELNHQQLITNIDLMKQDKINVENQILLIHQWQKAIYVANSF
jgi:hypothetical protein